MPKYTLVYVGTADMPDMSQMTPKQMQEGMAAWGAWYSGMSDALVDGGAPFSRSSSVAADGSTGNSSSLLTGYTIIQAADMAAAQQIARGCPVAANGLSVDIYECVDMPDM